MKLLCLWVKNKSPINHRQFSMAEPDASGSVPGFAGEWGLSPPLPPPTFTEPRRPESPDTDLHPQSQVYGLTTRQTTSQRTMGRLSRGEASAVGCGDRAGAGDAGVSPEPSRPRVCVCGGGICTSWPPLRDHKLKTQVGRRDQSPCESGQSLCDCSGSKGTSAGCDSQRLLRGGC